MINIERGEVYIKKREEGILYNILDNNIVYIWESPT
jgi:hypothetical protein